ncbi:hypothetical protein LXL04_030780 [Taraxacum kok-saghyz]
MPHIRIVHYEGHAGPPADVKKTNSLLRTDCRRLDHLFFRRALQMWSADCRRFDSEKTNRTLMGRNHRSKHFQSATKGYDDINDARQLRFALQTIDWIGRIKELEKLEEKKMSKAGKRLDQNDQEKARNWTTDYWKFFYNFLPKSTAQIGAQIRGPAPVPEKPAHQVLDQMSDRATISITRPHSERSRHSSDVTPPNLTAETSEGEDVIQSSKRLNLQLAASSLLNTSRDEQGLEGLSRFLRIAFLQFLAFMNDEDEARHFLGLGECSIYDDQESCSSEWREQQESRGMHMGKNNQRGVCMEHKKKAWGDDEADGSYNAIDLNRG